MPSQKLGTDRPTSVNPFASHSGQRPRYTAAATPAPMPTTTATVTAYALSHSVTGSVVAIRSDTGTPVAIEVPRSPCSRFFRNSQYCT